MEKLMKFENNDVQMIEINGEWLFELYSVGMALGQFRVAKGKNYPRKDRIDENVKNAEIKPVVRNGQPFITESQLYDLMLEVRTDKCRTFRKWLTNEVLPALNHEGTYTMPKEENPYEYFDKTYNGIPVLTAEDIEQMTGINRSTVDCFMKHKAESGKDYYPLTKTELRKFKAENPRIAKFIKHLNIITRSGFMKLCRAYGIKVEEPKCFEAKEEQQKSAIHRIFDEFKKYYDIERYALTDETAKALDVGKNGLVNESCLIKRSDSGKYQIFADKTAPLLEKQFMIAQNLGRILSGQLREGANPDINYGQDARTFAMVVMAMSLYFGN